MTLRGGFFFAAFGVVAAGFFAIGEPQMCVLFLLFTAFVAVDEICRAIGEKK